MAARNTSLASALVRRWRLTLLGALITAGLVYGAHDAFPIQYEAKATILLVPPSNTVGSNPYLNLGALQGLNDVLGQALMTGTAYETLKAQGLQGKYTVTNDITSNAPIVVVTSIAVNPAIAIADTREVVALLPKTLLALQQDVGVPKNALVTSAVLSPPIKTSPVRKTQTRGMIAGGAIGVLGTIILVGLAENVGTRRRRRREGLAREGASEDATKRRAIGYVEAASEAPDGAARTRDALIDHEEVADKSAVSAPRTRL